MARRLRAKARGKGKRERQGMGNRAGAPNAWAKRARQSHRLSLALLGKGPDKVRNPAKRRGMRQAEGLLVGNVCEKC